MYPTVDGHPGPVPASGYANSMAGGSHGYPHNPSPAAPPYIPDGIRARVAPGRWSTNLCHCCDDPANCVITCFCPCITFGQIAEIVDKGSRSCAASGAIYGFLAMTGLACLYSCFYRSKLRGQYDLDEAPCVDCLVHFCCEACALCQEYRELREHGYDMGIGWDANMDRQKRGVMMTPVMGQSMTR